MVNRKRVRSSERRKQKIEWMTKKRREDGSYAVIERERNKKFMTLVREDGEQREAERECNRERMERTREDDERRKSERERNKQSMSKMRKDERYKNEEREKNKQSMSKMREDERYKNEEREKNKQAMSKIREDRTYKKQERERNKQAMSKMRLDAEKSKELKHAPWERLLREYLAHIKQGPTQICASCGGMWFEKSMRNVHEDYYRQRKCSQEFLNNLLIIRNSDGRFRLCGTCFNSAAEEKIATKNLANGFRFPDVPDILTKLTQLEERLVSARIPFMQIRSIGIYQQKGLRGNVVNIENDLDICARTLPRTFDDTATVQVMLMRKMCYKSAYMHETVRPHVVHEAARYLCKSKLYEANGITFSEEWLSQHPGQTCKFIVDRKSLSQAPPIEKGETDSSTDEDEPDDLNPGADETLILRDDNLVVKFAPGEGKKPMAWLRDTDAEQLSFPSVYGGVPRVFKKGVKVSAVDIARSEARMYDRRAVKPEKILYTAKRLQNLQVSNQMQVWLRKRKGSKVTAGELKNEEFVDKLVSHDDGFRCLRKIRLSPAYWQGQEKKVLAMSRQLGIPTLFLTLSAAETKWAELLVILESVHNGNTICEKTALAMPFQEKAALIRSDPCICALYFDHRFRSLLNLILNKRNGAFNPHELLDYYNKIEFAHRGSAHNHGLYWLKNAPIYDRDDPESMQACVEFIDSLITCSRNGDEELEAVVGFQVHRHTHTCRRRTMAGGMKCRFNLPLPVMRETTILQPLSHEEPNYEKAKTDYERIQQKLNAMGKNFTEDIPFSQHLAELGLTEREYIMAIRSSIKRDKIFLRRRTCDIFINAYNEKILKAWKANMDIQFVLDPYACVKYCVAYLTKSCTGISKLMRDVEKEIQQGNLTMKEKLRKIANKFINSVEISAQEAAYLVLGLRLTNCSREDVFVNTGRPEDRVGLVKSMKELEELEDGSVDVFVSGLLEHYRQRPSELNSTCLAEFASFYKFSKVASSKSALMVQDGSGYVTRAKAKIVRYRRYNRQQDPGNYFREQLMLYVPWRNEKIELINVNVEAEFIRRQVTIQANRSTFDPHHGQNTVEDLVEEVEKDMMGPWAEYNKADTDPDYDTDIFGASGHSRQEKKVDFVVPPKQIPDMEYEQLIRSLNDGQRRYFLHLVHLLRTGITSYEFVAGGAGVGKSFLIHAIVQFLLRDFAIQPGVNLESLPVLICAPTGKAAFNIGGITVHCAFRLPPNEYHGELAKLSEDLCNSLRLKFRNLRLLIIDEISMLSVTKFFQIDARLRQIFQNELPFGGISTLVVGDFYQIRPVMAQFVFETPRSIPFGFIIGNELWSRFKMYELIQVMRQNKALAFAQALNNMARGQMTDENEALFRSRQISDSSMAPTDAIHLFCTNDECSVYNNEVHNRLTTESCISYAYDTVQGTTSENQREQFLAYVKTLKASDADGLATIVRLQVGAEYMVSTNVNVSDGVFNGSTGTLKRIEYSTNPDGTRIPTCVYMKFTSPMVGVETRRTNPSVGNLDPTWTPIRLLTKQLNKIGFNQGLTVTRRQIPLLPANGITIVKSQGSSYASLVVHMHKHMRRDLLYVACSRAFHPDGLYIVGEFRRPSPPPQYLLNEIARLQANPVELSLQFLQDCPSSLNRVMYHNVQSLHKHYLDVICDASYLVADYLCLLEPWTFRNEQYRFTCFNDIRRQDCQGIRSAYGSFLASKAPIKNYGFSYNKSGQQPLHSFTIWTVGKVICCMVYKYPNSSAKNFYQAMEDKLKEFGEELCLVFGDFNINIMAENYLANLFQSHGYRVIVPQSQHSTIGGTQIDLAFANFSQVRAWYYESVFSYHKPICIIWPRDEEVTKYGEEQLEGSMTKLELDEQVSDDGATILMDVENESEAGETFEAGTQLPLVTFENARRRHWRVAGFDLSLNELKTLATSLTSAEVNILSNLAAEHGEQFVPRYLTDRIIDTCIRISLPGRNSILIDYAVTQLVVNSTIEFPVQQGDWDNYDNVIMPINEGNHWMVLVVQPKRSEILFLDPSSDDIVPVYIRSMLLPIIQTILANPTLQIQTPMKTHQSDSWNCGVYIIKYVELILANKPLQCDFSPANFRNELTQRLWMNSEEYIDSLD